MRTVERQYQQVDRVTHTECYHVCSDVAAMPVRLDHRQTRYAIRALSADGDHPTHQLLPTNLRLGELYGYEGATAQPSSIGWTRPEKTHRLLGSRLVQQVVKHIEYDAEYGFDLPFKQDPPD
jgi:hypothetical protein